MPERWERELSKLRHIEMQEPAVRGRIERGPMGDHLPPRRDRLAAAVVAASVAIAATAFLWQVLPGDDRSNISGSSGDPPTLFVTFESDGRIDDGSEDQPRRVDTTISYGDAREESFTSTTPLGAHVDWVTAEDITRFVPGPTVASGIDFVTDGDHARVLIGEPDEWPNLALLDEIERLPDTPGEYVLVFEADYPEGIARTARRVRIVPTGVLQLDLRESGSDTAASGFAYVDGRRTEGFLSSTWFTAGDLRGQSEPRPPRFGDAAWLSVRSGSPILLGSAATEARAGLFATYDDFDLDARLPVDLLADASVVGPEGRHLLAVSVTWRHGKTGYGQDGTEERLLLFFPIELVAEEPELVPSPAASPEPSSTPSPLPTATPSPSVPMEPGIMVRIYGLGERSDDMPIVTATFGGQTRRGCVEAFKWTLPDGTRVDEALGRKDGLLSCSYDPLFQAAPGTPIVVVAQTATEMFLTRTTAPFYAGPDAVGASVIWPDGKGDFIVPFEVVAEPVSREIQLECPVDDRIAFAAPDGPRILPGGSAYITGNLEGFRPGDVVEQMTRHDGGGAGGWDGTWQVVRDGSVVAIVEFPELSGVACRGSGIGGV